MTDEKLEATLDLVRAAQSGNEQALDDLFERYLPRTRRIVACRMGWQMKKILEYDDLVQEAFLRIFQGLERFEPRTVGSFRQWVALCVERAIQDAARHARRAKRGGGRERRMADLAHESLTATIFAGDSPTPSVVVANKELEERLEKCLLELPERYRELVVLRSFCEMTFAEVAETLGFEREATARQAYSRAVGKLREMLDP